MCRVHLVPEIDELRRALKLFSCDECGRLVQRNSMYRHIEGALDDGSDRRHRYRAHEDCYSWAIFDVGKDGCFRYGRTSTLPK